MNTFLQNKDINKYVLLHKHLVIINYSLNIKKKPFFLKLLLLKKKE